MVTAAVTGAIAMSSDTCTLHGRSSTMAMLFVRKSQTAPGK